MKGRCSAKFMPGDCARRGLYNVMVFRERGSLAARGDRLQKDLCATGAARAIMRARAKREGPPILWWSVQARDRKANGAAKCVTGREPCFGSNSKVDAGDARTAVRVNSPPTEARCGDIERIQPFSERASWKMERFSYSDSRLSLTRGCRGSRLKKTM